MRCAPNRSMRFYIVASTLLRSPSEIEELLCVRGPDFVELRVDYLDDPLAVDYEALRGRPFIVTLRAPEEGGVKRHSPEVKAALLKRLRELEIMYDVEGSFVEKFGVDYEGAIVSFHYFSPPDRARVVELVKRYLGHAFAVKVATVPFPGYKAFLASLLELGEDVAVMPIGGTPAERVAFALLGSKLVYGYLREPTAPGQPHYTQFLALRDLLMRGGLLS